MVKQTRKRRNTVEKLAMEFCDGSMEVEPVDLGNDKQSKNARVILQERSVENQMLMQRKL